MNFDEKGRELYLTPEASDEALGQAVLDALAASRWILPRPTPGHVYHPDLAFDPETCSFIKEQKREQDWVWRVRKIYNYKSKREIYMPMRRCDIAKKRPKYYNQLPDSLPRQQLWRLLGFRRS